ncbi:MAG: class I SAM-dependent methyltransferase [Desulfobacteraceae bacterium]|nr:class I SAM-dependent methyltransferase [Desulfobacteraceae bacterium]
MKSGLAKVSKFIPGIEGIFLKKFIQILKREMIPIEIIDSNGKKYATISGDIQHKLLIKDPKFFNALISPDAFSLGEAYVKGYFDVSGSIRELYEMVWEKLLNTDQSKSLLTRFSKYFIKPQETEKQNIEYHYDIPSNFYKLFLGETMGYTCGYYTDSNTDMSEAQNEKMEIICRKLRLKKGDHLLDIGCGWGNFAIYAAKYYRVRVVGITLSCEQKKYADQWILREGLEQKVHIKILNYRDLGKEKFDKISCVGMSEHVGRINMNLFYKKVYNCLQDDGLFLQHTITTNIKRKNGYKNSFLDTFMFPGGELMFQQELINSATGSGFELLNAENFRVHYIKTLGDWIFQMETNKDKLIKIVSENIYRIYHVFFIGSLVSFRQKEIALFQNLFYKSKYYESTLNYFLTPFSKKGSKNESKIT